MAYIQSYRNQNYLLPPNIKDLFPKDHVCYLIEQIADQLNYKEFDKKYAGAGHPAYHPKINVKLLLMGYVDNIRSSRKIAKAANENNVYIFLSEKVQPDFNTISRFRRNNKKLIADVFKQINAFALKEGLIDLSQLITDGTIIKANANNQKVLDKKTLEKLEKHIEREIQKGIEVDEEEDKIYGDRGYHELPESLDSKEKRKDIVKKIVDEINKSIREDKKEDIKKIKETIDKAQRRLVKQGLKNFSLTDKDSRIMLNKKGRKELSYNAQLVTDKNGLIISNNVVQNCDDRNQLIPNIDLVEQDFGKLSDETKISADAGYENGKAIENLDNRGFDLFIPGKNMKEESKLKKFAKANFEYNEEKDIYICPEGKLLTKRGKYMHSQKKEEMIIYSTCKQDCLHCQHRAECCKTRNVRAIHAMPQDKLLNRIKFKLRSQEGKEVFRLRKQTVERSFGDIKGNKGFVSFLLRGLEKVKVEWDLACIAHNLVMINNKLRRKKPNIMNIKKSRSILDILAASC